MHHVNEHFTFAKIIHRLWHIKILYDYCMGVPWLGHNKTPLGNHQFYHKTQYSCKLEGACNWHATCGNVPRTFCQWIECSFDYHEQRCFPKNLAVHWTNHTITCNHTSPGPSGFLTGKITEQPSWQLMQQLVCKTKEFLLKLSETVSGKLICMLIVLTRVSTCLQLWVGKCWAFIAPWTSKKCSRRRWIPFHGTKMPICEQAGCILLTAIQMHRDTMTILRPIVVPFIRHHHLILQHDKAQPHVPWICKQFFKTGNIPVLARPADSPDIEYVWDSLDQCVIDVIPLKRSGCSTSHR